MTQSHPKGNEEKMKRRRKLGELSEMASMRVLSLSILRKQGRFPVRLQLCRCYLGVRLHCAQCPSVL